MGSLVAFRRNPTAIGLAIQPVWMTAQRDEGLALTTIRANRLFYPNLSLSAERIQLPKREPYELHNAEDNHLDG